MDVAAAEMTSRTFALGCGMFIWFMQPGFACLETGAYRATDALTIMLKNMVDAAICTIFYGLIGFGLNYSTPHTDAYYNTGPDTSSGYSFLGTGSFGLYNEHTDYVGWFVRLGYAANAATIMGGSIGGRTKLIAYIYVAAVVSGFIYPIASHWMWDPKGWLRIIAAHGAIDCSGSGVVHLLGGMVGLAGAQVVGPRLCRKDNTGKLRRRPPSHHPILSALGVSFLWLGWLGFNAASCLTVQFSNQMLSASRSIVNTMLAGSMGGLTLLFARRLRGNPYNLFSLGNGILAGLVSITAACAVVQPYASIIIGCIGTLIFVLSSEMIERCGIDDPLDAISVHAACGTWGVLAVGFFATREGIAEFRNFDLTDVESFGVLYGGNALLLGLQTLAVVAIAAWSYLPSLFLFWILQRISKLRIDEETELGGLDMLKHDFIAYPEFQLSAPRHLEITHHNTVGEQVLTYRASSHSLDESDVEMPSLFSWGITTQISEVSSSNQHRSLQDITLARRFAPDIEHSPHSNENELQIQKDECRTVSARAESP